MSDDIKLLLNAIISNQEQARARQEAFEYESTNRSNKSENDINAFRKEINKRFDEVEKRFDYVDREISIH